MALTYKSNVLLRAVTYLLILGILYVGALLIKTVLFSKITTPRTAVERSIMDAEAAVRGNPRNGEARLTLGMAYAEAGRYDKALRELETAVKLDPRNPEIYYGLGIVYKAMTEPDRAVEALSRATRLEGSMSDFYREAYYELGTVYRGQKKYKEAVAAFEGAMRNGPEATYVLVALAQAYEDAGDKEKAITEYREILRYRPEYKPAAEALARLTAANKEKSSK